MPANSDASTRIATDPVVAALARHSWPMPSTASTQPGVRVRPARPDTRIASARPAPLVPSSTPTAIATITSGADICAPSTARNVMSNRETALAQNRIRYISGATGVRIASRGEYWRTALTRWPSSAHARGSTSGGHQFAGGSRSTMPAASTTAKISAPLTSSSGTSGPLSTVNKKAIANGTEPYANAPVATLTFAAACSGYHLATVDEQVADTRPAPVPPATE